MILNETDHYRKVSFTLKRWYHQCKHCPGRWKYKHECRKSGFVFRYVKSNQTYWVNRYDPN